MVVGYMVRGIKPALIPCVIYETRDIERGDITLVMIICYYIFFRSGYIRYIYCGFIGTVIVLLLQ
jgi:hypothetical protein